MWNVIEYVKRFVSREPVLVRAAVGFALDVAVTKLGLDPALKAVLLVAITGAVAAWARSRVSPVA